MTGVKKYLGGGKKRTQVFTTSGTFTVPEGVTRVFVTGGGAGGGGCIGMSGTPMATQHGKAGGPTSFGNLLTLSGGGGAVNVTASNFQYPGPAGGPGGQVGGVVHPSSSTLVGAPGGCSGPYFGGQGISLSHSNPAIANGGYCSGGGGLYYNLSTGTGGGGGHFVYDHPIDVTPLSTIAVTIGQGGQGGVHDGAKAGNGGNGILTIEWWE